MPRRAALAGAVAGVAAWAIVLAPAVVFGYGTPQHTNQIGPGALSATTGGAPLLIGPGALAYRVVLAAASLLPMIVVAPVEFLGVVIPFEYFASIVVLVGFVTHGAAWAAWFAWRDTEAHDATDLRRVGERVAPRARQPGPGPVPDLR